MELGENNFFKSHISKEKLLLYIQMYKISIARLIFDALLSRMLEVLHFLMRYFFFNVTSSSQQSGSRGLRPGHQAGVLGQAELDPLGRCRGSAEMEMVSVHKTFKSANSSLHLFGVRGSSALWHDAPE